VNQTLAGSFGYGLCAVLSEGHPKCPSLFIISVAWFASHGMQRS